MSFTEKIFTLAITIVLFFLTLSVYLFETMAGNPNPPLETYYAGYMALGLSALSVVTYFLVTKLKKSEVNIKLDYSMPEDQSILNRLVAEIKATSQDCADLKIQLQLDPNASISAVIDERKRKVHQIYYLEVKDSLESDAFSDLLFRFIHAYTERLNDIKQDPARAIERLSALEEKISKESALNPIILRLKFKPKVAQIDPFFTQPLDRN